MDKFALRKFYRVVSKFVREFGIFDNFLGAAKEACRYFGVTEEMTRRILDVSFSVSVPATSHQRI